MAGLIKNQLLKHLSKFAKNLAPSSINLSTLKGEGELRDLELDEAVLTDVLDLPTWLRLSKATCNRVNIKIQWTKLKSQAICLCLDEVEVNMETCDEPRTPTSESPMGGYSGGPASKYGLAESIIDGMYVSINSVIVNFKSKTFMASIQLSRIIIQSKAPTWHSEENLRLTRIKDEKRGEIIIFKEAEWMTLRIEANAMEGAEATTPLRLIANQSKIRITIKKRLSGKHIANQSKIRITIKKRLSDCGVIASRLHINLDDLLWVLTDSQLKAALVFVNSLSTVVKKSSKQSKKMAAAKLKKQGHPASPVHPSARPHPQKAPSRSQQALARLFSKFDIKETSYHLYTGRIDLHLCDDAAPDRRLLRVLKDEDHRRKVQGGAMQVTLFKMALDSYPYHPAGTDRSHWLKYDKNMEKRDEWVNGLLASFKEDVRKVREEFLSPKSSPAHSATSGDGQTEVKAAPAPRPTKLLESCVVFRLEDFALYRVSTALDHKRSIPKKFMTSDKQRLFLPQDMSSVHLELTEYYFPEGIDYPTPKQPPPRSQPTPARPVSTHSSPDDDFVIVDADNSFLTSFVPHNNTYVLVNPIFLKLDFLTVLWLNAFVLNLLKKANIPETDGPQIHTDIRIEALMPRIILPADASVLSQADRPDGLQIQASQVMMSNCRVGDSASRLQLLRALDEFNRGRLFKDTLQQFPRDKDDLISIPSAFIKHLDKEDSPYFDKSVESVLRGQGVPSEIERATNELLNPLKKSQSTTGLTYYNMTNDSFKLDATKDVWCLSVDQFWMEFVGVPSSRNRPVPFVESFPLTVWLAKPLLSLQSESSVCVPSQSSSTLSSSESGDSTLCASSGDGSRASRSRSRSLLKQYYSTEERPPVPNGFEASTKPANKKPEDEGSCVERLADLHIITHLSAKISVQLNHYQYLFLMRLVDTVTKVMDELEDDTVFITRSPLPAKKTSLAVLIKEVEVAFVCPPIPEIPSLQVSPDDSEDLQEAFDIHKAGSTGSQVTDGGATGGLDRGDSALGVSLTSGRSHDLSSNGTLVHKSSTGEMDVFTDDSPDDLTNELFPLSNHHPPHDHHHQTHDHQSPQIHLSASVDNASAISSNRSRSVSPQSRASPAHSNSSATGNSYAPSGTTRGQHQLHRKDSDIKKSITAFSNFTKGVAKKINKSVKTHLDMPGAGGDDSQPDDQDGASTRSGDSDDDDNYIMTKFQDASEAPAFESKFTFSDDASVADYGGPGGARDGDPRGALMGGAGLDRAQGVVSVVCIKLHSSEAAISVRGTDVAVAATVDHVIPEEHGNVNLDKFHDRFLNLNRENKSFSVESLPRLSDSPIRLRFVKGPAAELLAPSGGQKGFLRAEVADFHAKLLTSTLGSLGDLFEDEKAPDVMPMFVKIENTTVVIKDNKPPTHEPAAPSKDPIELCVSRLVVRRREDGQFNITTEDTYSDPATKTKPSDTTTTDDRAPTVTREEAQAAEIARLQGELRELSGQQATAADVTRLSTENDQLRRHLEKIGKMSTASGGFNIEALQDELEKWKHKASDRKVLKRTNDELLEQLSAQTDKCLLLKQERESLLATINMMQEELNQSELQRYRSSSVKGHRH